MENPIDEEALIEVQEVAQLRNGTMQREMFVVAAALKSLLNIHIAQGISRLRINVLSDIFALWTRISLEVRQHRVLAMRIPMSSIRTIATVDRRNQLATAMKVVRRIIIIWSVRILRRGMDTVKSRDGAMDVITDMAAMSTDTFTIRSTTEGRKSEEEGATATVVVVLGDEEVNTSPSWAIR
jgi:hypothetical protein